MSLMAQEMYDGLAFVCKVFVVPSYDMLYFSGKLWASGRLREKVLCILITPVHMCLSFVNMLVLALVFILLIAVIALCMFLVVFFLVVCPYWLMQHLARIIM